MSDSTDRYDALGYWLAQRVTAERIHRRRVTRRQLQRTIHNMSRTFTAVAEAIRRIGECINATWGPAFRTGRSVRQHEETR